MGVAEWISYGLCNKGQQTASETAIHTVKTDTENRPVVAKRDGCRGGMDREFGIRRCILLHIEWINNKVLHYSTGNYIQCPMINHNGKECMYLYLPISIYI